MNVPPPMNPPPDDPQTPQTSASTGIPTYLVWSIIVTVLSLCLCCVIGTIPGIVAIVFATKVKSSLDAGDIDGALRLARLGAADVVTRPFAPDVVARKIERRLRRAKPGSP